MSKRLSVRKPTFHFLLRLLLLYLATVHGNAFADLLLDAKAPDFQAQDLQGKQHRLSGYAGKIVVLEWSSPECPYSRRYYENGTLDSLYEYAANNGIVWINIVPPLQKMPQAQTQQRFALSKKIVILDTRLVISSAYGADTTPQIFIIDKQGNLAYSGAIDSTAMLKKTTRKVVPYTRHALEDLLQGRRVAKKITRAFGCYVKNTAQSADKTFKLIGTGSR